ncbi:hypothetical protein GYMLUDRAFT_265856 [Collybiopsis luxurians FD-317 M1]|uniref:Uncharacterized protein n=1 Tax=Collybiopsis luxurians FD-317 M1 TaxID=944289 RepID=A0A0D0AM80_9AGAR|nr:hypothetical protein GYMLUDRAFT_265856 [Collybiopsis luxurians FD-317 M1]
MRVTPFQISLFIFLEILAVCGCPTPQNNHTELASASVTAPTQKNHSDFIIGIPGFPAQGHNESITPVGLGLTKPGVSGEKSSAGGVTFGGQNKSSTIIDPIQVQNGSANNFSGNPGFIGVPVMGQNKTSNVTATLTATSGKESSASFTIGGQNESSTVNSSQGNNGSVNDFSGNSGIIGVPVLGQNKTVIPPNVTATLTAIFGEESSAGIILGSLPQSNTQNSSDAVNVPVEGQNPSIVSALSGTMTATADSVPESTTSTIVSVGQNDGISVQTAGNETFNGGLQVLGMGCFGDRCLSN